MGAEGTDHAEAAVTRVFLLDDHEIVRRGLRELLEGLNAGGFSLDTLSMGMSADLEAAIAEGATLRASRSMLLDATRGTTSAGRLQVGGEQGAGGCGGQEAEGLGAGHQMSPPRPVAGAGASGSVRLEVWS
mgnify:CR=1 FL=1